MRARAAGVSDTTAFALGAYQRWYATQAMNPAATSRSRAGQGLLLTDARLYARRAPGNTCLSALAWSFTRASMATVRDPPNGSKGCGAVMRAAPFGLVARSREEAFIAGNLLGVQLGAAALPSRWCAEVEMGDLIARVARDLYRAAKGDGPFDAREYPPVDGVFAAR